MRDAINDLAGYRRTGQLAALVGAVILSLSMGGLAYAAAQITYLNFATGAPGSYNAINGSGFGTSGTISFTSPAGNESISYPTGNNSNLILSWTDGRIIFKVPSDLVGTALDPGAPSDDLLRQVYGVSVNGSNVMDFDASTYPPGTATDVKPHGNFSTTTDFCLSCHMVHVGNDGAKIQYNYALLGSDFTKGTLAENVVSQVCENCHTVGVVGPNLPAGYTGPDGGFGGSEAVATTAHYDVYKNGQQIHPMGALPSQSFDFGPNVTINYLQLNTQAYQSAQYNQQAPRGLYCGSCHSPHGNFSANAWLGWDAAQFSENYGNNYDSNVRVSSPLPDSTGTDYWRVFIASNPGTQPLTNALLIVNPGHQNGIGNANGNPNVPSSAEVLSRYTGGGISMHFSPYIEQNNTDYPGGWVDPLFDAHETNSGTPIYTGATNDTLSNFCMGCHNLNGGDWSGMQGHPAHPLQGTLSPDNAGISQTFPTDHSGAYGHILDGCTDCHGAPEIVSGDWATGFSMVPANPADDPNFSSDYPLFDFPHSQAITSYQPNTDKLLKATPDGLCLSCHDSHPHWSSLP